MGSNLFRESLRGSCLVTFWGLCGSFNHSPSRVFLAFAPRNFLLEVFVPKTGALGVERPGHGGSEKPGKLEVGGASRDPTGFGALAEGLISS